jgi:hypothetical protein
VTFMVGCFLWFKIWNFLLLIHFLWRKCALFTLILLREWIMSKRLLLYFKQVSWQWDQKWSSKMTSKCNPKI